MLLVKRYHYSLSRGTTTPCQEVPLLLVKKYHYSWSRVTTAPGHEVSSNPGQEVTNASSYSGGLEFKPRSSNLLIASVVLLPLQTYAWIDHSHILLHSLSSYVRRGLKRCKHYCSDQPRGLLVRVSDYWSWGPGFDCRLYHGDFSLKGKFPMVTMVWVV
jgi:hypothetical protein